MSNDHSKRRILVIGIDGASFNFVDPWLAQGLLPNFQKLIDEGASGDEESCLPPVTMPAWRVFSTSKYPGKLGAFWHQQLDADTRKVITPNATFFNNTTADYWDYLNQAGLKTGIIGMPDTYPPRPLDGFMVCAGPSAAATGYAYPEGVVEEIESDKVGFQLNIKGDFFHADENSAVVQEALKVVDRTFAAGEYLMTKFDVDVLQITTFDINRIQHFFYDEGPSLKAWQIVDEWLGKLRPQFDYTFILSDHGTEKLKKTYFLNVWLRQNGYLKTRTHPLDILPKLGINRTTIGGVMQKLGLMRFFSFETLLKFGSMLPGSTGVFGEFGNQAVVKRVDWSKTKAFALAQGPLYINRALVKDDGEYERLRDELIEKIEAITDPDTGERITKKVFKREDIYHGPNVSRAPNLLVLNHDAYHNRAGLAQDSVFAKTWKWKGNNRHYGLFMIAGPGITPGVKVQGVRIVDISPTVLHAAGVPLPNDIDGRVVQQAIDPNSPLGQRRVAYQESLIADPLLAAQPASAGYTHEDEEMVGARLKDLGYLD